MRSEFRCVVCCASDVTFGREVAVCFGKKSANFQILDVPVCATVCAGRQISRQLPRGVTIPVSELEVYGL